MIGTVPAWRISQGMAPFSPADLLDTWRHGYRF
jgi:hypothetical protein